ncbi:baculovirus J domain protein [Spodoptera frugiperda multiple nucleopolyhedrovirus]|uniref:BJDP n=1 Tax=Spodoptera frugiperda nuclear polyhedrosis virus TaxID=10455 RepID=A1YJA2_NPVSF|nr:baculovirus J domain protein [Spodoptera frugiperda multiple nucleopolyhedrovirus]ABM45822.1 baculovirus J domain protein [Spodoptera frugiperda multiple nucleopolyhedrovirus]ADV91345.1 BJDP [Spodoptera frugiperda multiple nucleopolyhedrovirus]AFH59056.1 BJDP [Spodoptera frugiperda multiple nucleopolyhedrovirus]QED40025.1 baculovirus J domain protein [Spodoptera frugiperda multiple nucleopolyhedrovirus]QED40312.1 baculovirus J domain protein [Spodoptera frugiperda multiple nucleopolyhedrovi
MSRVTRSSTRLNVPSTTAVVSPRKRTISVAPSPPSSFLKRATSTATSDKSKRTSGGSLRSTSESSSTNSSEKPVAAKVSRKEDALYFLNLDSISYYDLLNVGRNATKADITSKVNNLQHTYKKSRVGRDVAATSENTNEKIHSTLGNALQVLGLPQNRKAYDRYMVEKDKINHYFNEKIMPLRKTANEIYSSALRLQNDAKDFYEMDIQLMLKENVYKTIQLKIKNKHYKTTITNRLLVEWQVSEDDTIDEEYLENYFKDDGIVALIMCSNRPGCAVIELLTQRNIKDIVERESKRKKFIVRDYTEAEMGIDHTNYSPQIDKINVIENDINELERKISNDYNFIKNIEVDDVILQDIERRLNFSSAFDKMESSGEESYDNDEEMSYYDSDDETMDQD